MRILHDADARYHGAVPITDAAGRLTKGVSIVVIALLSALSWLLFVAITMMLRATI